MSRSLAELAALVADTNLDPFDRMCHAASLTNQAHAATAELARTCALRGEESLDGPGGSPRHVADDVGRLIGWEQLRPSRGRLTGHIRSFRMGPAASVRHNPRASPKEFPRRKINDGHSARRRRACAQRIALSSQSTLGRTKFGQLTWARRLVARVRERYCYRRT
jgi:hypothetical protein